MEHQSFFDLVPAMWVILISTQHWICQIFKSAHIPYPTKVSAQWHQYISRVIAMFSCPLKTSYYRCVLYHSGSQNLPNWDYTEQYVLGSRVVHSRDSQIGSQEPTKAQGTALLPLLGVTQVDQSTHLSHIFRGCRSFLCRLPGSWFRLCEFQWPRLHVSAFCGILDPSDSYNPYSLSSAGFPEPKRNLMFGCESLHVFLSVTEWRLPDDNWGSHQTDQ